jgi:DNA invertase Pin-like site-specific DNA recombinase
LWLQEINDDIVIYKHDGLEVVILIYGYIRVSTDKQTTENQEYEIYKFADSKGFMIDEWVKETVSSRKKLEYRKINDLISNAAENDIIVCTEVSRLGRSIMEVMSILNILMEKNCKVYTTKEKYELGNDINSKVLAFAFSLSAEIERNMISQRTKEALARISNEGRKLGRPKGSLSKKTKLTGKEEEIKKYLNMQIPKTVIAKLLGVNRNTLHNFIKSRKIISGQN